VFVLESRFDVLVLPDGLAVLNATPFALLNEDLFKGGLTGTAYSADRKRRR
jgi:hypothetical protein